MSTRKAFLLCLALGLAAVVPYAGVARLGFTNFDDPGYVTANPHVLGGLSADGLRWAWTSFEQWNWHPLTWVSHMADVQVFGTNPAGHHVTNLLFHAFNTLLLFAALVLMTRSAWRSAFVAALFAVHPLHVESVAWIAERKDVLSAFFWMLVLVSWAVYVRKPGPARYLCVFASFALGLAAKPMLVTLPFVLLLLDYWPLERLDPAAQPVGLRRLVVEKLPLLALSGVSSMVTFVAQQSGGAVVPFDRLPLSERLSGAVLAAGGYIGKMFWPTHLAAFYPRQETAGLPALVGAALLLTGVTGLALCKGARRKYLPAGWFWYLGTLVPVIGIVQVGDQAMADRYTYLPLIGLFVLISWGGAELFDRFRIANGFRAAAAVAVVSVLGFATARQVPVWTDSISLWRHALSVSPRNELACLNLGAALAERGNPDDALSLYRGYLERFGGSADIHANLGAILLLRGREDEALQHFDAALRLVPAHPEALNGSSAILRSRGNLEQALRRVEDALAARPAFPEARFNRALVLLARGDADAAAADLGAALKLRSAYAEAHEKLGDILTGKGQYQAAIPHYLRAAERKPRSLPLHNRLGLAFYRAGMLDDAAAEFRKALELEPGHLEALNNLAWLLATRESVQQKDGAEAVELAVRELQLQKGKPDSNDFDTLAAAYAAAGRFPEAVREADRAIAAANAAGQFAFEAEVRRRRALYTSGHRFVEKQTRGPAVSPSASRH